MHGAFWAAMGSSASSANSTRGKEPWQYALLQLPSRPAEACALKVLVHVHHIRNSHTIVFSPTLGLHTTPNMRAAAILVALLALTGTALAAEPKSVADVVISLKDKGYGILLEAVLAADKSILDALSNPKLEATVFAPDDKAFALLLKQLRISKEDLLKNKALLTQVLSYHVLGVPVPSSALKIRQTVQTLLEGKTGLLKITKKFNHRLHQTVVRLYATSGGTAKVVQADIKVGKSYIHAINRVLVPGTQGIRH
ncbi:hypothetical protein ABPG75_006397 [Micractinium tetrahymenae]